MTVRESILQWLYLVKISIRPNTYNDYLYTINHVLEIIGHYPLEKLDRTIVQNLYIRLNNELGAKVALHVHRVFRVYVNYAIDNDILVKNPLRGVILPKREKYHPQTLSADELQRLLRCAEKTDIYCAVLLASCAGLRRGECLALRKSYVNKKNLTIDIHYSAHYDKTGIVLARPKSEQSYRTIAVSEVFIERLFDSAPSGEYFCPYDQHRLQKEFSRLLEENGFKHIRFHDLRHTFASLMLERGADVKLISMVLGHSNITLTLNTYAHVTTKSKRAIADKLDELL